MFEAVIFDYGRTIYNPETQQLFPGTEQVFKELTARQIRLGLVSIADTSVEERSKDLVRLGVRYFFGSVQIFGRREEKDFTRVLAELETKAKKSIVVGDNLRREITIGNRIGAYTVWTRQKLSGLYTPRNQEETPKATIETIQELIPVVDRLNA